ncbi:hypothetical protein AX774_g7128, partial [Zancudomyces culisetae]
MGAQRGEFQLRIDYESRTVVFDIDPLDSARPSDPSTQLQPSPAELMRLQLQNIATTL